MLISRYRVTARMLVSLRNQQNVNFTQRVSSKVLISSLNRLNIDFTFTRDGKDVDFN